MDPPSAKGFGATPGAVACGDAQCRLEDQACCTVRDGKGHLSHACVARAPDGKTYQACEKMLEHAPSPEEAFFDLAECDEPGDCPSGSVCCTDPIYLRGDTRTSCLEPELHCRVAERCRSTSDCHSKRTACAVDPDDCPFGVASCHAPRCAPTESVVESCNGARCAGSTPTCCAGGRWGRGACVARGACDANAFRCIGPADCGPARTCCFDGGWEARKPATFCMPACIGEGMNIACRSDDDCAAKPDPPDHACMMHVEGLAAPPELKACP